MNIQTDMLLNYIEEQKKNWPLTTPLHEGVRDGLDLVKEFIELWENKEGEEIAREYGEK